MPTAEARLRQFYRRFGEHRFADLVGMLSDDVWYIQLNSMTIDSSPRGPQAVGAAYANWGRWFENFEITEIAIEPKGEEEVRRVGGAAYCFVVHYGLDGKYVTPIPGLRGMRMAINSHPGFLVTDKVWMNHAHKINRVTNVLRLL